MSEVKLVYVTVPSHDEAERIAETAVRDKLAACANLIDGVTSIFEWNGTLCRENETVLILKTQAEQIEALTVRIKQLHSYDCPCIVSLPIETGHRPFLEWVANQTDHPIH